MNLKTIADKAGVSKTTVSNVINGNYQRVSEKTRLKIEKLIEENDYQPNAMAKGLASKESKIIGLVVPNVDESESFCVNPYDVQIIGLLENYIRRKGYFLMLRSVRESRESIPLFSSWNVDGMIFFGTFKRELEDIKRDLKVPAVFLDTYSENLEIANIGIDDYQAGYLSAAYLIGKGHRKIAFAAPSIAEPGVMQKRFFGFRDACEAEGIEVTKDRIFEVDTLYRTGGTAVSERADYKRALTICSKIR